MPLSLDPDELSVALGLLPSLDPELAPIMSRLALRQAAVCVPLFEREGVWHVLLTERSQRLSTHKGQVSFPGGRVDPEDPSVQAAALREQWEEVGIPVEQAAILGPLPAVFSSSGYHMAPFVAVVPPLSPWSPNPDEIAHILEVPLDALFQPDALHIKSIRQLGPYQYPVFSFHWHDPFCGRRFEIWGATARVLTSLLPLLGSLPAPIEPTTLPLWIVDLRLDS